MSQRSPQPHRQARSRAIRVTNTGPTLPFGPIRIPAWFAVPAMSLVVVVAAFVALVAVIT
jgi:hypothetical protein